MIMAIIRPETEMKDSGVQWLGNVPKEWSVGKVKHEFYATKTIVGDKVNDYERLALTLNGVIKRSKDAGDGLQPEKFDGYQILKEHELVFKLIDLANVSTSRVGLSPYTGIVSPAYIVLHHRKDMNPRYGEYYFLSMWMNEVFNHIGGDGVRSALNAKDLLNIPYLKVSSDEQQAIADYLDKTCSKIDEIIAEAKASIDEYKELRLSVLTSATTKGLSNDVKYKDSGSRWVDEIPSDWSKMKIHYIIDMPVIDGPHVSPELVSEGVNYISANAIVDGNIDFNKRRGYITREYSNECRKRYSPQKNDILVVKLGASTGKMAMVEDFTDFDIWVPIAVVRCKKEVNAKYVYYSMSSKYFKDEIKDGWTFGTQETLGVKTLESLYIFLPSRVEQDEIVRYLDEQLPKYDSLIAEKESLINDLEAYKKSLIYEVVTGKRRVV